MCVFVNWHVFGGLVARKCEKHDGVAPAVIDIGAVVGYSSIQAAVSGCAVLAIEANVGDCHLIRASAALNGVRAVSCGQLAVLLLFKCLFVSFWCSLRTV